MRVVVQRVSKASVEVDEKVIGAIQQGLLILLGIEEEDNDEDAQWLCAKISQMRIFGDHEDKMNLDVKQVSGDILVVSQFTLHASVKKGNRPSFIKAARPERAIPLYEFFKSTLSKEMNKDVQCGEFGAMMQVKLINDGPVTILIDSKNRE
ncbi:MAG: D-aminoacyl-tRNA deacylase [Flavobacteriales bacterium]|nr:D-aminoacyl-tRNA deacylase [Flavobacteriales bacterium]